MTTITARTKPPFPAPPPQRLPPLENGDRLTREEFERRWDATPGLKKAELIEGVVHRAPPVSEEHHGEPHARVVTWLGVFGAATPGVVVGDNSTLRLDARNEFQPDGYLRLLPEHGGQARRGAGGYVIGTPELLVEVSASSASHDLRAKLDVYRRHGVKEYVVFRVYDRAIDWFVWREGQYQPLAPDRRGVYRSLTFPGLWLDAEAMLRDDPATVLKTLRRGIVSQAHHDFLRRLQPNKARAKRGAKGAATRPATRKRKKNP